MLKVYATGLAGNAQSKVGSARLTVKQQRRRRRHRTQTLSPAPFRGMAAAVGFLGRTPLIAG
jgi:hypothetical protein